MNKIVHLLFFILYTMRNTKCKKSCWKHLCTNWCVLKQALAFLEILLLPVWQGIELNSTHLKKCLQNIKEENMLHEASIKSVYELYTVSFRINIWNLLISIFAVRCMYALYKHITVWTSKTKTQLIDLTSRKLDHIFLCQRIFIIFIIWYFYLDFVALIHGLIWISFRNVPSVFCPWLTLPHTTSN